MDEQQSSGNSLMDYGSRQIAFGRRLFITYAWIITRNIIGWLLIVFSIPFGALSPGPGGLPMFLIGFAMISFPGKRKLTARVVRGKPIPIDSRAYKWVIAAICVLAPMGVVLYVYIQREDPLFRPALHQFGSENQGSVYLMGYMLLAIGLWVLLWPGRSILNAALRVIARVRRKVRPWLRRHGFNLLPARRRRRRLTANGPFQRGADPEILEIDERHYRTAGILWNRAKPWLWRAIAVAITGAIFWHIYQSIHHEWPTVRHQIFATNPLKFGVASGMFAVFLAFRAICWRRILIGLGHRLPLAPAVRIWATSELARYVPGAVWQVLGRVYLVKPYGVSGSISSTSQILELAIFLLANIILAAGCFLYFGVKVHAEARPWLYGCAALVPALAILLHPKIFYGLVNRLMVRLKKPPLNDQLGGWPLLRMLGRILLALLWQNAAVFILVQPVLGLKIDHWWTVCGAYCLAWCAGFLAIWAPGGIGVRELVFIGAMHFVLPQQIVGQLEGGSGEALLGFLAILLRIWTIVGELIVTGIAYLVDFRGAMNLPGAKGRIARDRNGPVSKLQSSV
jgi:uncharacterized membrane protein YbhN (UPF0104 family)